jgi:hypothetical protein
MTGPGGFGASLLERGSQSLPALSRPGEDQRSAGNLGTAVELFRILSSRSRIEPPGNIRTRLVNYHRHVVALRN